MNGDNVAYHNEATNIYTNGTLHDMLCKDACLKQPGPDLEYLSDELEM